jgi:Zn-dependent peptidase ImmA (M78 family)
MSRSQYYSELRALAQAKRLEHKVRTSTLNLRFVQCIYRTEGIKIDYWDYKSRKIRAAYLCDDGEYSVAVNKNLPREPKLFALIHELKHHYNDQEALKDGHIKCGDYNANELIEKGAEVFAAEFIYPEDEMRALADQLGICAGNCNPEQIVEFKRSCGAYVSYRFLVKRFEWFNFIASGAYRKVQFQNLEEKMYGVPFYKQKWREKNKPLVV